MNLLEKEFESLDLGDKRLNKRGRQLLTDLGNHPNGSIPDGWNETKAAYRFFDNPKVTEEKIVFPHKTSTLERIAKVETALLLQDTTELDYTGQSCNQTMGYLNQEARKGLYFHPTIAVTPDRLCLGVIDMYHWSREQLKNKDKKTKNRENLKLPIEKKESYRWVKSYLKACEVSAIYPDKKIVSVGDREYDIYEVFLEAHHKKTDGQPHAELLMRSMSDRRLQKDNGKLANQKLWSQTRASDVIGYIEFDLPARKGLPTRRVKQAIRMAKVKLAPPWSKSKCHRSNPSQAIEVTAILCSEIDTPKDAESIEWLLLSSELLNSKQEAFERIQWYLYRWEIEIYFKVLKSGCQIESLQLETPDRYFPCLALYMIIAWRILFITRLGRIDPDMSCNKVFHESEWQSVYAIQNSGNLPDKIPSLSLMMTMIAGLGGYLNRKHDRPPGPKTIWRGIQKMRCVAMSWNILNRKNKRKTYG